jgi:hypothetical protein
MTTLPTRRDCCESAPGAAPHAPGCLMVDFAAADFSADELALTVIVRSGGLSGDDPTVNAVLGDWITSLADNEEALEIRSALRAAIDNPGTRQRVFGFVGTWFDYEIAGASS